MVLLSFGTTIFYFFSPPNICTTTTDKAHQDNDGAESKHRTSRCGDTGPGNSFDKWNLWRTWGSHVPTSCVSFLLLAFFLLRVSCVYLFLSAADRWIFMALLCRNQRLPPGQRLCNVLKTLTSLFFTPWLPADKRAATSSQISTCRIWCERSFTFQCSCSAVLLTCFYGCLNVAVSILHILMYSFIKLWFSFLDTFSSPHEEDWPELNRAHLTVDLNHVSLLNLCV